MDENAHRKFVSFPNQMVDLSIVFVSSPEGPSLGVEKLPGDRTAIGSGDRPIVIHVKQ